MKNTDTTKLENVRSLIIRSFIYDRIAELIDRAVATIGTPDFPQYIEAIFSQLAEMPEDNECNALEILRIIKLRAAHDKQNTEFELTHEFSYSCDEKSTEDQCEECNDKEDKSKE